MLSMAFLILNITMYLYVPIVTNCKIDPSLFGHLYFIWKLKKIIQAMRD